MRRKIASVLGALALASGLLVATPGLAQAAYEDCPASGGYFCVFLYPGGAYLGYATPGRGYWPAGVRNNDHSWYNRGYYCYGCDHVRIYDSDNNRGFGAGLTLCVHRGQKGDWWDGAAANRASARGDRHTWGGECRSWEPQMTSPY
jgi:hypothetical protein